jgi:putative acetyltransferase
MTGVDMTIGPEVADADDVRDLVATHLAFARRHTPAADVRALPVEAITDPSISMFGARVEGRLVGIGALRRLDADHAEIKTMHTLAAFRGRGIGRAVLDHLVAVARDRGYRRVSLETGTMDAFAPSREVYARAGFRVCPPFGEHRKGPNSVCMTMDLDAPS